jgi:Domain of unknown function (DUF4249)
MLAAACKKVVNVDLRNAAPQIVIEGEVTDAPGDYLVKISKTVDYSASNTYPPVSGATVFITDSTSHYTNQLREVDSGMYMTTDVVGIPQHTFQLKVIIGDQTYTASSTMPVRVPLDSITFAENIGFNGQQEINAVVNFQDPPGTPNYYQFIEMDNDRLIPDIFVFEDRLSDGRYIEEPLFNDSSYLQRRDNLVLTMNCIDENIYNYFFTLANISANNNGQSVTPSNPVSNITNGALGYFSAHTTQRGTLQVY